MAIRFNQHDSPLSNNERVILEIVRRNAGIRRSSVAPLTNLTQPSVHRITDGLLEAGYLNLGHTVINGRGKPSKGLELNALALFSIGISVNTDSVSLCLCDFCCNVIAQEVMEISPARRRQTLLALKRRSTKLMQQHQLAHSGLAGVGFAISGFRVLPDGNFVTPEPLSDWSHVNIASELTELFDTAVWVENNATIGAIGEALVGAGLDYPTFGYLSFDYGFGAGVIIDGKPVFGAYGNAGEISRIYTLDEAVHRPALGELIKVLNAHGVCISSVAELRQRFDPAWPGVDEWVAEVAPYLNRAIDAMWAVFDPAAIVFGGELPIALGKKLMALPCNPRYWRTGVAAPEPARMLSQVGKDPVALGAALIPLKELYFS